MSESERRRARRRKKMTRSIKKTVVSIALAPGKMPRITAEKSDRLMRICEMVAIVFVVVLMMHLISPTVVGTYMVVLIGTAFAALLGLILLGDYQDKLVEYELYGFKI